VSVICITKRWVNHSADDRLGTVSWGDIAACEVASALGLLSPSRKGSCALGGHAAEFVFYPRLHSGGGDKIALPPVQHPPVGASL
jgi:hypothetical protein